MRSFIFLLQQSHAKSIHKYAIIRFKMPKDGKILDILSLHISDFLLPELSTYFAWCSSIDHCCYSRWHSVAVAIVTISVPYYRSCYIAMSFNWMHSISRAIIDRYTLKMNKARLCVSFHANIKYKLKNYFTFTQRKIYVLCILWWHHILVFNITMSILY